ncbi:hypothetical protein M758_9G138200 [Ceratodon purpureus]|nr:hypothetical protein M758_9G138200 [Ceratodon purpureus]
MFGSVGDMVWGFMGAGQVRCSGGVQSGSCRKGRLMTFRVGVGEVNSASRTSSSERRTLRPTLNGRHRRRDTRIRGAEDDFEVEDAVDYEMDGTGEDDEDEGDLRDYDTEYDMPMGEYTVQESETFMSTEGVEEERIVDYKIDEDEFHKICLYDCDFFIRKVPDQDDDVFDFREMYVTAPDTDTYAIPKVIGEMPKKPLRCMKSNYEYVSVTEPPVDTPRAPLSKTEYQAMKVFLIKHYRNLREDHEDFVLDFENIYVIDSTKKSITKADVKVEVRRGKYRDRDAETLIVRDDGTTFKIIPSEEVHNPDQVIQALQWDRTKENMDNYLRGFRDYEKSRWF